MHVHKFFLFMPWWFHVHIFIFFSCHGSSIGRMLSFLLVCHAFGMSWWFHEGIVLQIWYRADSEALGGLSDLPVSQDFAALAVCSSWLLQVELLRAVAHAMTVRKKGKMTRMRLSQHAVLDRLFGHTKKA